MTGQREGPSRRPACPICGKPSEPPTRPFCSTRCADVDLGRWLNERYVIPEPTEPDGHREEDDGRNKLPPRR